MDTTNSSEGDMFSDSVNTSPLYETIKKRSNRVRPISITSSDSDDPIPDSEDKIIIECSDSNDEDVVASTPETSLPTKSFRQPSYRSKTIAFSSSESDSSSAEEEAADSVAELTPPEHTTSELGCTAPNKDPVSSSVDLTESPLIPPTSSNVEQKMLSLVMSEVQRNLPNHGEKASRGQMLRDEIIKKYDELKKVKGMLISTNLAALPDRGVRLQLKVVELEKTLKRLNEDCAMGDFITGASDDKENVAVMQQYLALPSASIGIKRPLGEKALEAQRVEKVLTVDAVEKLHDSLKTCPTEDTFAEDPKALKNVTLMPHQKQALAWLVWREQQKPRAGILADDMGLGKTLTMISLVLKSMEMQLEFKNRNGRMDDEDDEDSEENEENSGWYSKAEKKVNGGTLVVCPASLLSQWEGEVQRRCKRNAIDVLVYHGPARESRPHRLARLDMVITTYSIVRVEAALVTSKKGQKRVGPIMRVRWNRIILDEAHVVRNFKSQTSQAVCALRARYRWALTGTPIHNKELDLYALLKFLRCSPFDNLHVWRHWVDNKNAAGIERLNTVMKSLMLRRTKDQLQEKGELECLPSKTFHLIPVKLDEEEFAVYEKVLDFSRTLFAQFLHQKAEREQVEAADSEASKNPTYLRGDVPDNQFRLNKELSGLNDRLKNMKDIKSFEILVLLLRLRQVCCHPALIKAMIEEDSRDTDGIVDTDGLDIDLVSQMGNLGLTTSSGPGGSGETEELKDTILCHDNPVFKTERASTKLRIMLEMLDEMVVKTGDKAVIVSQWTTMLHILADHLRGMRVRHEMLCGSVPVKERNTLVDKFNAPDSGPQVLLLSLTAGGVGLNLIGGNHLFLFDLHWNPQLEAQACDRIYRVGQKKPVHIYKFVCEDTIEQRIRILQEGKLELASNVMTGARQTQANKLSLNDLRMLFGL